MKRLFASVIVILLLLVSCGKADVIIRTDLENTRSSAPTRETTSTVLTAATNADGLISEADLLELFDRTLDAYDQLETQYSAEMPDAA